MAFIERGKYQRCRTPGCKRRVRADGLCFKCYMREYMRRYRQAQKAGPERVSNKADRSRETEGNYDT